MSNRHIEPTKILPTQAVAAGDTVTSLILDMRTICRGSVSFDYSAGFVSSFFLAGSTSGLPGTFVNLNVNLPAANNVAGSSTTDLSILGYAYFQCTAVVTVGAGTLTIWANAKGF